ncbi:hypothetical protein KG112_11720 [Nocardioides sp. zg-ZUI104]|uniref:hypothetical protein n=1 Tax=Nocardioides faecalis TaxID=2803858 RepID=UPI001BCD3761|nr:hypothetical protein [Nocardioides faecalis]MBS4753471.1 hypothetical protein [Nocardioides faecalis]
MTPMTTRKNLSVFAVLLATSSLALTACGGEDEDTDAKDKTSQSTEETTEATETPTESAETETSPVAPAAPAGDVTAPGTELAIGEPAVVPFTSGTDSSGTVEVTITEIKKGSADDLKPLNLGDRAAGLVPYYIQVNVKGVSGSETLAHTSINESIEGALPDGSRAQTLSIIGTFEPCDNVSFPGEFADGTSYTTCVPYLAQESTEVSSARYAQRDSEYSSYDGKPVVWK